MYEFWSDLSYYAERSARLQCEAARERLLRGLEADSPRRAARWRKMLRVARPR
jgi:hypothetical protein